MSKRHAKGALAASLMTLLALGGCETDQTNSAPVTSSMSGGASPATTSSASTMVSTIPAAVTVATQRTAPNLPTNQIRDLPWIDGDVFDRQMSGALRQNPVEVRVDLEAPLSQLPSRMNVWLNEISERGGNVSSMTEQAWERFSAAQTAEVRTRAAFLLQLLPLAVQYISQRIREEATYGPAANYDVIMVTNSQRNRIQLVVFRHKQAP
jgi:hypothetical protein